MQDAQTGSSSNSFKTILFWVVVVLGVLYMMRVCNEETGTSGSSAAKTYKITYLVSSAGSYGEVQVDVTFSNETGKTSQVADKRTPWKYEFEAKSGAYLYVSAQNQGKHGGVKAAILVDGKEVKSSISEGAFVIASASGML